MQNINRLLENSCRRYVRGTNTYTAGRLSLTRPNAYQDISQWDAPAPGLPGIAAIGHHIDTVNLILPEILANGVRQEFVPIRHRWTPAYSDTYYRARPCGEYQRSGMISLHETKCFTEDDVFVSHLTIASDDREPIDIELSLQVPFEPQDKGTYRVTASILPRALGKPMTLQGYAAAKTDRGRFPASAGKRTAYRAGL